jgi:hypothetical protein
MTTSRYVEVRLLSDPLGNAMFELRKLPTVKAATYVSASGTIYVDLHEPVSSEHAVREMLAKALLKAFDVSIETYGEATE